MHMENPRATLKLSATPGHYEVDLLNWTREAAVMDSTRYLGAREGVGQRRKYFPSFLRGAGLSPEAGLLVSQLLSDQRLHGDMERHGFQLVMCLSPLPLMISSVSGQTWRRTDPLCIVMSPTQTRLLDLGGSCKMEDTLCASLQQTVR